MSEEQVKQIRAFASMLRAKDAARAKEFEMLEKLASTLKGASVRLLFAVQRSDPARIQEIAKMLGEVSDKMQAFVEEEKE